MKSFLLRLTSRKFLMAVAAAITLYLQGDLVGMMIVVLGYLGVEGLADTAERYKSGTSASPYDLVDDEEVNADGNTPTYNRAVVPGSQQQ